MTKKIAFTGRADELTVDQKEVLTALIYGLNETYKQITVGTNDGEGADQWIKRMCADGNIPTWETDASLRPMPRNRQLASECDTLLAAPPTECLLKKGSGTWETIKYGWKYGKEVIVIDPAGRVYTRREHVPSRPEDVVPTRFGSQAIFPHRR